MDNRDAGIDESLGSGDKDSSGTTVIVRYSGGRLKWALFAAGVVVIYLTVLGVILGLLLRCAVV